MNVYIGGDSWGLGEWEYRRGNNANNHRGLAQYLNAAGHNVHNASVTGAGNLQVLAQIQDRIINHTYDLFILFQTCSIRDNNEWDSLVEWEDFIERNKELKARHFKKLAALPIKIHLVGGLECVRPEEVQAYPNLVLAVESIPEWLTDGAYKADHLVSPISVNCVRMKKVNFHDQLSRNTSFAALDQMEANSDYWYNTVATNKQYFQPDGAHANRYGHKELYNRLKEEGII